MLALSNVRLMPSTPAQAVGGQAAAALDLPESVFNHEFAPGEITVVLGANRAGKTDLCRLIAGLDTVATGEVSLDEVVYPPAERHEHVSMVYQSFVNYPNLTVAQNIASPLRAARRSAQEIATAVDAMAERLRIGDLLERMPHELSGGQQQRVAIARALAKQARVVLLDEPLVNLDFKLREALELELRDVLQDSGAVVIYTSSDPQDAFTLGDHLLLLQDGALVQSGTPSEVYTQPDSLLSMSMLCDFQVNEFMDSNDPELVSGLRPEHVYFVGGARGVSRPDGAAPAPVSPTSEPVLLDLSFPAEVSAIETNGDRTFVHCRIKRSTEMHDHPQDWLVRHDGMLDLKPGQPVELGARSADVRRFKRG